MKQVLYTNIACTFCYIGQSMSCTESILSSIMQAALTYQQLAVTLEVNIYDVLIDIHWNAEQ